MRQFQKKSERETEFLEGFILQRREILGGSKFLFSLFTQRYGIVSVIIDPNYAPHRNMISGIAPMDYVEISSKKPLYQEILKNTLIYAQSLFLITSAEEQFCHTTSPQQLRLEWKRVFFQIGILIRSYCLEGAPKEEVWNFLSSLYGVKQPLLYPEAFLILIILFFFQDEGIDIEGLQSGAQKIPREFQSEVQQDISIVLQGESEILSNHRFSQKTVELFLDLIKK